MNESMNRKLGVILSYISILVSSIIQLLYTPLLIRMLGQSEYGLYSLSASIIGYLAILDFGFGNAIVVYTSKYREQGKKEEIKKLHGMFLIIFIIIGIISAILGLILFFNVDKIFGNSMTLVELKKMKKIMLILSFNLLMTFSFSIYNSIIIAYEKFVFQKIIGIAGSIIKPIIMIPLLFLGYKSVALCIVITLVNVAILITNYQYCKKKLNIKIKFIGFDKKIFKIIFGFSVWIFLNSIVDKANWSVDNFILGTISGTTAVSIYAIASVLNGFFINLSQAVSGVFLPKMTKMVAKGSSREELTNEMIKVGRIQWYILFLMCSGLVLFGKRFISFWAGNEYEESYYVSLLLIIPLCIPLIQNLGLSIMQAMNKYKFKAIITFVMAIFNVIVSIFLSKSLGAIGAALGTCIALIICNVLIMNLYYHIVLKLNMIKFWKEILRQTIPLFIPIIFIMLIMYIMELDNIDGLIVYGSIYTLSYSIIAYLISMNKYEKKLINNLIKKIHLRKVQQ